MITGLAAVATAAGLVSGCGTGSAATDDGVLSLAVQVPSSTFDPVMMDCESGRLYCQAAYDTLLHRDPHGDPVPGMASDFEYDPSHTSLHLVLRDGIAFSDGAPFDAQAAKANLDGFASRQGPNSSQAAQIESVEATAPMELEIRLSAPDPALLSNLASNLGMMASPAALGTDALATAPVGSGPYLLDTAGAQNGVDRFVRNPDYRDPSAYPFDEVEVHEISDSNTVINGLTVGQLDAGVIVSPDMADSAGISTVQVDTGWVGLILADRDGRLQPALADTRVR
ncbi:hypothetical protein FO059_06705 [Tomitella fengzijianii]|uniref:Solute-binding protein family 5 domain-containing protein n=1 Tax=Tomitella fengzijianii TaxID=2597660 RepID=A0A516X1X9_9ACTN|nr:hypothetical protein FO059_06705 [Tomitella fengzijianii]